MKLFFKTFMFVAAAAAVMTACNKVDDLPNYGNGSAPQLTASAASVAAAPADSSADLITFSWTTPAYAADPSTFKYIVEIDAAGNGFAHAASRTVIGSLSTTFTGKEMNNVLLGLGFAFNVAGDVEVRVISSYGNNNERLTSNVVTVNATPYKVPPIVPLPLSQHLYIVGGATDFGWSNPAQMDPVRELTRLNETTWAGIYHLNGGQGYLLLPDAGSWANKYSVLDNSIPGAANGGSFGFNNPQDFPGNVAQGDNWYRMTYDFQSGRYTVVKEDHALGANLYITGDATNDGWTNSPSPAQQFTQLTNGIFEITMSFVPGKLYKFLNTLGQWQPQFGGDSATGTTLGSNYGGGNDPAAIPTPATAGNYKVRVDFHAGTYTVTPL